MVSTAFTRGVILICACLFISGAAFAQTVVNVNTEDQLIAAIQDANSRGGSTVIRVAPRSYVFTQSFTSPYGATALPPIAASIVVKGHTAGDTILANQDQLARLFTVLEGARLVVKNITLTGGLVECNSTFDCTRSGGGAVANVGGQLRLEQCVLTRNNAYYQDGVGDTRGGAISSVEGVLQIADCSITDNGVLGNGGAIALIGGTANIDGSIIHSNGLTVGLSNGGQARGGGIDLIGTALTISNSTISANTGPSDFEWHLLGGGIYNDGGNVRLLNSAVIDNYAQHGGAGGGIYNAGTLYARNSTIGGNLNGVFGGGVYNTGQAIFESVTVAGNELTGDHNCCTPGHSVPPLPRGCDFVENPSACTSGGAGIWNEPSGIVQIKSSVIADNTLRSAPSDCGGTLSSRGHNAIESSADCTVQNARPSDQLDVETLLGTLRDNGTAGNAHYPVLAGSLLIDAGGAVGQACRARDQLGRPRTDGNSDGVVRCEAGSVERAAP